MVMKTRYLLMLLTLLLGIGCAEPTGQTTEIENIKLMDPGNLAIIKNKIKVAHMICGELGHCENNNDTIMTTYYDSQGRLVKIWQPNTKMGEEYIYTDNTNWETRRIAYMENLRDTNDIKYAVNKQTKTLTEYILYRGDTASTVVYKFNDEGQVYEYNSSKDEINTYITYNPEGLVSKLSKQYPDTTVYINKHGKNDMYVAYRAEEEFYYYEARLDSSVKKYFDIYGNQSFEPVYVKYRFDGLMESIKGLHLYIFSYEK